MNDRRGLLIYSILSYINLFFAALMGASILLILPFAFSQPAMLFQVFLITGVILYSFSSFRFLQKGLKGSLVFRPGFSDFIKVNAFVALFFLIQSLGGLLEIILNQDIIQRFMEAFSAQTSDAVSGMAPAEQTKFKESLVSILNAFIWIFISYNICLLTHILFSFRFIKKNPQLFEKK